MIVNLNNTKSVSMYSMASAKVQNYQLEGFDLLSSGFFFERLKKKFIEEGWKIPNCWNPKEHIEVQFPKNPDNGEQDFMYLTITTSPAPQRFEALLTIFFTGDIGFKKTRSEGETEELAISDLVKRKVFEVAEELNCERR